MVNPFALEHLLPAGCVLLELVGEVPIHNSEDEDWSTLRLAWQLASGASEETAHEIDFLVAHDFVRATWHRTLHVYVQVRVYLVPYDLPGVGGCLRHRDEVKLLGPARRALRSLLCKTDAPFFRVPSDTRTLSEIFGGLPSPVVEPSTFLSGASAEVQMALSDALQWDAPPGMRQSLYPYQRRTVARMLQQELDPGLAIDPLYIPIPGVKTFYLQPSTMELLQEPPMRAQAPGGILCEEMGTGKTCMVLALIMATKSQLSAPEEAPWDAPERIVLTPLAFRHFPSAQFERARSNARVKTPRESVPTLVEVLTNFFCTSPQWLGPPECYKQIEQKPHLWEPLMHNRPFYHVYQHIPETTSPRRREAKRGPCKIFLTSATLVVVPRAILVQWISEINKHCEGGSLRVLVLDTQGKTQMPSAQILASQYDMVLMTHEKFAAEKVRCDLPELFSWKHCECGELEGTRVPCCTCPGSDSISPLIQIRWKRLVVDEGHVSAAQNNLAVLAHELSVERRWIVSGTPTRNLMGLSLGQPHDPALAIDDDLETLSSDEDDSHTVAHMDVDGLPLAARRWTEVDRDDLNRLSDMISKFIGVPQFAYEMDLFRKRVSAPLLDPGGPRFGAIQVLTQVMGQVMFRHQILTIEQELPDKLPPLKEKTVVLKFRPLAAKTYNVLQSLIAVNAVDSERKDQDYLFHPRNRRRLTAVLQNLRQTMFWRTDPNLFDIDEAVMRSETALIVALERGMPESDIKLVEECIRVQSDAARDHLWRDVMLHEDNPFTIRGLAPSVQNAWLKLEASPRENGVSLLDPDRIMKLRNILVKSPLISEERLAEHGFDVTAQEKEDAVKHENYVRSLKRKRRLDEDMPTNPIVRKENSKSGSKEMLQEINQELSAAIDRRARGMTASSEIFPATNGVIASRSSFFSLRIGNSLSSKIDYVLQKVLTHAAKEKFLVFSAFPLSLAYLAEALQVVQVPYLLCISGVKPRVRQQTVVTFETSDKYRVLLMELKLGARGLNLVTASRIIFCEPVWQGDIESQAIKRAHRIGQRNDLIKVSTLVMQGTSEEVMVTRRSALKRKSEKLPAMEEDVSMRKFMQNPTFIKLEDIEPYAKDTLDIPLIPKPAPGTIDPSVGDDIYDREGDTKTEASRINIIFSESDKMEEPLLKKTKTVRFS